MNPLQTKMFISNENTKGVLDILDNIQVGKKEDFLSTSEYRDIYNGERLYHGDHTSKVYVSKRSNDESDFWRGGKYCYDDPLLKSEAIYKTITRKDFDGYNVPEQFQHKDHNRTVTRISEYSNALYNNNVFKNPSFLSC